MSTKTRDAPCRRHADNLYTHCLNCQIGTLIAKVEQLQREKIRKNIIIHALVAELEGCYGKNTSALVQETANINRSSGERDKDSSKE